MFIFPPCSLFFSFFFPLIFPYFCHLFSLFSSIFPSITFIFPVPYSQFTSFVPLYPFSPFSPFFPFFPLSPLSPPLFSPFSPFYPFSFFIFYPQTPNFYFPRPLLLGEGKCKIFTPDPSCGILTSFQPLSPPTRGSGHRKKRAGFLDFYNISIILLTIFLKIGTQLHKLKLTPKTRPPNGIVCQFSEKIKNNGKTRKPAFSCQLPCVGGRTSV